MSYFAADMEASCCSFHSLLQSINTVPLFDSCCHSWLFFVSLCFHSDLDCHGFSCAARSFDDIFYLNAIIHSHLQVGLFGFVLVLFLFFSFSLFLIERRFFFFVLFCFVNVVIFFSIASQSIFYNG